MGLRHALCKYHICTKALVMIESANAYQTREHRLKSHIEHKWAAENEGTCLLTRPAVNIAVNKMISNELDTTINVIASQFSGHCHVISNRW